MILILILQLFVYLVGAICGFAVVVSAFRKSVGQGLLCLFVPLYAYFWAFTQFDHPQRRPIVWIMFGALPIGFLLGLISR